MQPRKVLTRAEALAFAADALREVGLERHAWLVEDPVRLELTDLLATQDWFELEYENRLCAACGLTCDTDTDLHEEDCFVLHAWKYLGDPRWEQQLAENERREADEARRAAERAEEARLLKELGQCSHTPEKRGRCTLHQGHPGDHRNPWTTTSLSGLLKEVYSDRAIENAVYQGNPLTNLFGVDRSADPVRLRGVIAETPVGHFDETGAWHPNRKDLPSDDPASRLITDLKKEPSVIISPFIKDGDAFLFNNTLAVSPNDSRFVEGSPADAIRRAKEALDKMSKGEK